MAFLKRMRTEFYALIAWSMPHLALAATCTTGGDSNKLANPLSVCSLSQFVEQALQVFVLIMLPVIAFFIVLAGFNFVMARGNSEKLKIAKWNFLYVIVGTCLMLGAWLLANLIGATVSQVTG